MTHLAGLDTINATNDISPLLTYGNTVTNGQFAPAVLFAFFCIALIAGYYGQVRFTGRGRFKDCFGVASMLTLGLSVLMASIDGLLDGWYIFLCAVIATLGVMWLLIADDDGL